MLTMSPTGRRITLAEPWDHPPQPVWLCSYPRWTPCHDDLTLIATRWRGHVVVARADSPGSVLSLYPITGATTRQPPSAVAVIDHPLRIVRLLDLADLVGELLSSPGDAWT